MFTWKRFALATGGLLLLILLFAMLVLPGMAIDRATRWVAEETGRKLTIESVSINPFSLSIEIRKLSLSDTDHNKPFVAWDLLRVSLSTASIYHRAPVIDELRLDRPTIHLERLTEDTFNFSDLIPPEEEKSTPEAVSEPARFSINNISISNGQIDLVDSSLEQQVHHTIEDLQLVLPAIGNLPYMVENPATPLFKAVINDAPIDIEGDLKPFTNNREMQFGIVLNDIDLPFYLDYIPVELPVELRNGKLNLDLDILYRISENNGNEVILSGKLDLVSLNIWDKLQKQLFFLPLLQVEIAPSQPINQDIHLSALRVYNLEVKLDRDETGTWNHARMAQSDQQEAPEEQSEEPSSPFKLAIDTIEIRDGVLYLVDKLPAGGFETVAKEININVTDFSLNTETGIPFTVSLETDRDETVDVNGHFLLKPFTLALETELNDIQLGAYKPYYQEFYSQPLDGTLGLKTSLLVNPEQPLLISNAQLALRDLGVAFNDKEGVDVSRFDINGLSFDMASNRLGIDSVSSTDTKANFSRAKDGSWSFMSENFPILSKPAEDSTQSAKQQANSVAGEAGPEFSYRIGEVAINNWQFGFVDNQPATQARVSVDDLNLTMSNLAAPEKVKSPLQLGMTLQRKGRVEIQGTTSLADFATSVSTRLKKIPLPTLAPYVAEYTNLVLADGWLNARLRTIVTPADKEFKVGFGGDLGVSKMHLLDGTHQEDLLKWDSLQVAGIKGGVTPFDLAIDSITLSDYFAKVLIDEEARLNLTEAFKKDGDEVAEEEEGEVGATEPEETEEKAEEPDSEAPDIRIGKVVLQGGQVDFTDQSLPRPFRADMRDLGGRIDGLSSATDARAEIDLRGNLRNQSPLNITGTLNPLAKDLFLDIELSFRDIELSPFSPYSGNFVGYMIEKGKLNLALDYTIEDNQLKASNKVFIDQFNFGQAIESENATSLPVKLAVALLKDGNGEIHLDIPVYGSLEDPQFSIGGVVWTVIKNLLVKAATSPFALLGALVGGGEEDFSSISFDHGSARLDITEQDKLQRMAKALVDRPSLEVEISGFIDPEKDPEGYRKVRLSSKIKRLRYLDLVKDGELPEGTLEADVTIPAKDYPDYLWQVYRKEDFPKPRNFIGMTKKLPAAEMEKLIYANTEVGEDQLAELAQARALAVQNFLVEDGQLAAERIFLKEPDITAAPDQDTAYRARVELGATVR
jgi:hypothetical protein